MRFWDRVIVATAALALLASAVLLGQRFDYDNPEEIKGLPANSSRILKAEVEPGRLVLHVQEGFTELGPTGEELNWTPLRGYTLAVLPEDNPALAQLVEDLLDAAYVHAAGERGWSGEVEKEARGR